MRLFNCWDLVIGMEILPTEERDEVGLLSNFDDVDEYGDRYQYTTAYFLETIESKWVILLATHKAPPAIWQAFENKFAREYTSSFFDQVNSVFDTKYDTLDPPPDHINDEYNPLWNRLHIYCSTASLSIDPLYPFFSKMCSSHWKLKQPSFSVHTQN